MECEKMSKLFNVKSKKGISLAYALIVCLFLFLITGGIATVALLQQNETGSDSMCVRRIFQQKADWTQ